MANFVVVVLAVVALLAVGYLFYSHYGTPDISSLSRMSNLKGSNIDGFANAASPADQTSMQSNTSLLSPQPTESVNASETMQYIEQPQSLDAAYNTGSQLSQLPSECYPKDVLSGADLLPRDSNSLWAQVNPSGQGSLADQNFLTAGFHIGINTVGQSLRNPNLQLRSEPPNPQMKVSPWMQTTIEPDLNRRPLEIQGDI